MKKASMVLAATRLTAGSSVIPNKLGRCRRCMRLSSMGLVLSTAVALLAYLFYPRGILLLPASLGAAFFFGLTLSHLIAYALRRLAESRYHRPAPAAAPASDGASAAVSRRDFLRRGTLASVALFLGRFLLPVAAGSGTLFMTGCTCSEGCTSRCKKLVDWWCVRDWRCGTWVDCPDRVNYYRRGWLDDQCKCWYNLADCGYVRELVCGGCC